MEALQESLAPLRTQPARTAPVLDSIFEKRDWARTDAPDGPPVVGALRGLRRAGLRHAEPGSARERDYQPAEPAAAAEKPTRVPGLLSTHFLGVLNDTALKTLFSVWVVTLMPKDEAGTYVSLATGLFTLPYILFSIAAGKLADRYDKGRIVHRLKLAEFGIVAAGAAAFYFQSLPALLAVIFLMGAESAWISPAKYSLIPERVRESAITRVNGLMEMNTFWSLILGTAAGGLLLEAFGASLGLAGLVFAAVAALAAWTSRVLPGSRPEVPGAEAARAAAQGSAGKLRMPRPLVLAALAIAFFWFLSSLLQMNILLYGEHSLGVSERMITALLTTIGIFTGLGSFAAGWISRKRLELALVPVGALGVALFLLDLGLFGGASLARAFVDLAGLSFAAGLFYIPLNAYLQKESPEAARGRFLGISNLMTFAAILASAGVFYLLNSALAMSPPAIFAIAGGLAAAVAAALGYALRKALKEAVLTRLSSRRF